MKRSLWPVALVPTSILNSCVTAGLEGGFLGKAGIVFDNASYIAR